MAAAMLAAPGLMFGSSGTSSAGQGDLGGKITHQLANLPYYGVFDVLSFQVDGGKVTLVGQVTQPVVKEDAEQAVKRIPGVETVVNQIEVLPLSRLDDQIRRKVYYAVYAYGPLERYALGSQPAIRIIVKNGNVTLIGAVANAMDRETVFERANMVPGVFSVKNRLSIEI